MTQKKKRATPNSQEIGIAIAYHPGIDQVILRLLKPQVELNARAVARLMLLLHKNLSKMNPNTRDLTRVMEGQTQQFSNEVVIASAQTLLESSIALKNSPVIVRLFPDDGGRGIPSGYSKPAKVEDPTHPDCIGIAIGVAVTTPEEATELTQLIVAWQEQREAKAHAR